jgi:hypothetical protein
MSLLYSLLLPCLSRQHYVFRNERVNVYQLFVCLGDYLGCLIEHPREPKAVLGYERLKGNPFAFNPYLRIGIQLGLV